jgi:hypothetical protein
MNDKFEEAKKLYLKVWEKAQVMENRRKSGVTRLKRFPLLHRIVFFHKFQKIRKIIKQREETRSVMVLMALGMVRKLKLIKRKANAH